MVKKIMKEFPEYKPEYIKGISDPKEIYIILHQLKKIDFPIYEYNDPGDLLRKAYSKMNFYLMKNCMDRMDPIDGSSEIKCMEKIIDNSPPNEVVEYFGNKGLFSNLVILEYIRKNNRRIFLKLLRNKNFPSPHFANRFLSELAEKGWMEEIKCLIEEIGCDVNYKDGDVLRSAVWGGHIDLVKYLIEKGADHKLRNCSSLNLSIKRRHTKITEYLQSL